MQTKKISYTTGKWLWIACSICLNSLLCVICKADYHLSDGNLVREYAFGTELKKESINPIRLVDTGDNKYIYLVENGPSTPTLSTYAGNSKESISTMIAVVNRPSSIDLTKIKIDSTQSGINVGRQIAEFLPSPFPDGNWTFQTTALQLLALATIEPDNLDSILNERYYSLKCLVEAEYTKSDIKLQKNAGTELVYEIKATDEYIKGTSFENFTVGRLELSEWNGFSHQGITLTIYGKGVRKYPTPEHPEYDSRWTISIAKPILHKSPWNSNLSPFGNAETAVTDKRHPGTTTDGHLFYILPSSSSIPFSDSKLIKNLIRRSDENAPKDANPIKKWAIILLIFSSAIAVITKLKKTKNEENTHQQ